MTPEERRQPARQYRRNPHLDRLLRWRETAPKAFQALSPATRHRLAQHEARQRAYREEQAQARSGQQ